MRNIWIVVVLSALALSCGQAQQPVAPDSQGQSGADTIDKVANPPKLIHKVTPETPSDPGNPRNFRCAVSIDIDAKGVTQQARIIRSTDPEYARRCQKAIAQYKYEPATTQAGKPVPETSVIDISTHRDDAPPYKIRVRFSFSSPTGTKSNGPDTKGVYPYTKIVTSPAMTRFMDNGYGDAAYDEEGSSPCDVLLTIDTNGKALDPVVSHCSKPKLDRPAMDSLINSQYKPGN